MSLATYRRPTLSFLETFSVFTRNAEARHRYLLTFKDGAHLVGVPTVPPSEDRSDPNATFEVATTVARYGIPFKLLAYAQQLVESGLRASDGQAPVPEPCSGPPHRIKHEKFAILDSPRLLSDDLSGSHGVFGVSVQTVLPGFQSLVAAAVQRHGFAYAEGGDEVVIVLPNTSTALAAAFAEELRRRIEGHPFAIDNASAHITVSIGLASSTTGSTQLTEWANLAKAEAKLRGRNRTVTTGDGKTFHDAGMPGADRRVGASPSSS